jgi:cytochrome o ubiquinol oxidase operon protein cyoD
MGNHTAAQMKYGAKAKTLKSYLMGLAFSLIFTFSAFAIVGKHLLNVSDTYMTITALAVAQLLAQVICFLRMNVSREGSWNTMPFIFTFLVVGVLVGGSLWIMYNLNVNMM